jgi:hypothetical protein
LKIVFLSILLAVSLALPAVAKEDKAEKDLNDYGLSRYATIADSSDATEKFYNDPVETDLAKKIDALGKYATTTRVDVNTDIKAINFKIADIERRLSGVQNQVTVLHSKKADKEELQKTRDQVAHITAALRSKLQKKADNSKVEILDQELSAEVDSLGKAIKKK